MARTILASAALIDGSGAPPVTGRSVGVERGRIAAVVADTAAPSGTTVRLDGLTLLPGLIDCHVHLCFGGEPDPAAEMLKEAQVEATAAQVLGLEQETGRWHPAWRPTCWPWPAIRPIGSRRSTRCGW